MIPPRAAPGLNPLGARALISGEHGQSARLGAGCYPATFRVANRLSKFAVSNTHRPGTALPEEVLRAAVPLVIPSEARDLTGYSPRRLLTTPPVLREVPRVARDDKSRNRATIRTHFAVVFRFPLLLAFASLLFVGSRRNRNKNQ